MRAASTGLSSALAISKSSACDERGAWWRAVVGQCQITRHHQKSTAAGCCTASSYSHSPDSPSGHISKILRIHPAGPSAGVGGQTLARRCAMVWTAQLQPPDTCGTACSKTALQATAQIRIAHAVEVAQQSAKC